jgi:large repetitive protein
MCKSYNAYFLQQVFLATLLLFGVLPAHAQYSNLPPIAKDVEQCVVFGKILEYDLALAVFDPNDDPVSITILKQPLYGSLSLTNTKFTYKPDTSGLKDIFVYSVCDNRGLCNVGAVTIELASEAAEEPPPPIEIQRFTLKVGERLKINHPNIGYRLLHNGGTEYNTIYTLSHDAALTKLDYVSDSTIAVRPLNKIGKDEIVLEGCSVVRQNVYTCEGVRLKYVCRSVEFIIDVQDSTASLAPPAADNISLCLVKGNEAVHADLKAAVKTTNGDIEKIELLREPKFGVSTMSSDKILVYSPSDLRNIPYGKIDSMTYRACDKNGLCDTAKIYIRFAEKLTNIKKDNPSYNYRISLDENLALCGNLGKTLTNTKGQTMQCDVNFGKWTRQTDDCVLFTPKKIGVDTVRFLKCKTSASKPFYTCDGLQQANDCEAVTYIITTFMRKTTSEIALKAIKTNETWSLSVPKKSSEVLIAPRSGILSIKKGKSADQINYRPKNNFIGIDSFKLACNSRNYFLCEDKWYKINVKSLKEDLFTAKSTSDVVYNIDGEQKKIFVRSSDHSFTGGLKVRVFNMFGEEIFLKTIRRAKFDEAIDIKMLPKGFYKVIIQTGSFLAKEKMMI